MSFNEGEFRGRVDKCVSRARTILENHKHPQYPGEVEHTYDDKFLLAEVVVGLGVQSDLVAHNRSELEELKARGERDYFEFDLRKGSRQRVGSVHLELKRTDIKKQRYTLNLTADDRTTEKRDKTLFEPVQFYQEGFRAPTEIVVNRIDKDRIVGYISFPKGKETRQPMGSKS